MFLQQFVFTPSDSLKKNLLSSIHYDKSEADSLPPRANIMNLL